MGNGECRRGCRTTCPDTPCTLRSCSGDWDYELGQKREEGTNVCTKPTGPWTFLTVCPLMRFGPHTRIVFEGKK